MRLDKRCSLTFLCSLLLLEANGDTSLNISSCMQFQISLIILTFYSSLFSFSVSLVGNNLFEHELTLNIWSNVYFRFFTGTSLSAWGDPKALPGGYTLKSSCNDATYYLPIPLRFLRSVEMSGATGVQGELSISGSPPGCCGCCSLFAVNSLTPKYMCHSNFKYLLFEDLYAGLLLANQQGLYSSFIPLGLVRANHANASGVKELTP